MEAEITEKADELTALKTLHEQQRNEEKQFDKQEVEKEEKLKLFNEEAARIVENYNKLNADRTKFETRMGEKEAELAEEEAANNEAEANRTDEDPEVNRAREVLLRDYVDVY